MRVAVVILMMVLMNLLHHRFHFQDEIASSCVGMIWVKNTAIGLKSPTLLFPAVLVKLMEIVSPQEVKLILLIIIAVHFHIVKQHVPWHILHSQIGAPCVESGRPEVHFQVLSLVHELHCLMMISVEITHHVTIQGESDIAGSPLDLVSMPVAADCVMLAGIGVIFYLIVAIAVDSVGGEGISLRRNYVQIDLVPTTWVETRPVPVGEE